MSREYPPAKRMGGIATYLKIVAEEFVKQGHKVTVVAANDDTRFRRDEKINGVNIIRLQGGDFFVPEEESNDSKIKRLRSLYRFYSYRKLIRKEIEKIPDIDIIEVAEYGAEYLYLLNLKIPLTIRLHTATLLDRSTGRIKDFKLSRIHEYILGKKEKRILEKVPFISSCCNSLLEWTQNYYNIEASNPVVIYNPINLSLWKYNTEVDYMENSILFAGTVTKEKGIRDLIDACLFLRKSGIPVMLTVAGKLGSYGEKLKEEISKDNKDWCKILGHVSQNQLRELYSSHKVSCFPSWWEALGMVCLEAMACGNITLTSDIGGFSEIITDGKDGFLVKQKDPKQLALKLKNALGLSKEDVESIKFNARNTLREKFSVELISKNLEKHYQNVIAAWK
ncbi:MAG: glycosyltransferase family 4 protein [Muribaculaceae bacterium]|nr:glycosyltransferase family 4 protein [Muribaculaceae bacterium]